MSTRRAFALAAVALSGGCALASGYDFGKYTETGGAGGAGGRVASATVSSGAVGGSSASSSARTTASATVGSTGPSSASASSAGVGVGTSTSSATSTSATATSSSSGSPPGTVVTLYDNLAGPEAITVDPQLVYFTLNNPGQTGKSGAGYVTKDGSKQDIWTSLQDAVPAIWSTGSSLYVATNVGTTGHIYSLDVAANQVTGVAAVPNVTMQGLAVWGSTVFFTTQGSNTWYIPPAGTPGTFVPGDIAAGPITADAMGVYYVDVGGRVMQASLNGGVSSAIGVAPGAVYGITTDFAYVYWTDQSGGVYRATKGSNTPPVTLTAPDQTPAFGLAIDSSDTMIYFAHGSSLEVVTFPWGASKVLAAGLVNPRGVAVDDTYVYVAVHGSGTAPDGKILRITR